MISWFSVTATPSNKSSPLVGNEVILTVCRLSPLSISVNGKSVLLKVYELSSSVVIVLSSEVGILLILTVIEPLPVKANGVDVPWSPVFPSLMV